MGTTYEVKVIDNISSYHKDRIQFKLDSILLSINQSLSTYIIDSDISYINNDDIVYKSFNINKDLALLDKSIYYFKLTDGAFDVTVKTRWKYGALEVLHQQNYLQVMKLRMLLNLLELIKLS